MPKLWRVKMGATAIYLVIGVLSLTACIFVSLHGEGHSINIDKEYDPSINLGESEHDESREDSGTSGDDNANNDSDNEQATGSTTPEGIVD